MLPLKPFGKCHDICSVASFSIENNAIKRLHLLAVIWNQFFFAINEWKIDI
jgi:hypothetical protein